MVSSLVNPDKVSSKKILGVSIAIEILIIVSAILLDGFSTISLQKITRFSGRFSLLLFSIIFLLHGTNMEVWSSSKLYLVFAVVHGIHLIELLSYVIISDAKLVPIRIAGGMLAYTFIFIMPILDLKQSKNQLTKQKFNLFENVFLYYVWLIFFLTYLPRVQGKLPLVGGNYDEFVILLAWVSTMLGIKLMMLMSSRK